MLKIAVVDNPTAVWTLWTSMSRQRCEIDGWFKLSIYIVLVGQSNNNNNNNNNNQYYCYQWRHWLTFDLHIAWGECNRFNIIRIRVLISFWNYIVSMDVVVVSAKSLRLVHVFCKSTDTDWKKTAVMIEYPAVCLRRDSSPWRHFDLTHTQTYTHLSVAEQYE